MALRMPMCDRPFAPPPLNTSPILGLGPGDAAGPRVTLSCAFRPPPVRRSVVQQKRRKRCFMHKNLPDSSHPSNGLLQLHDLLEDLLVLFVRFAQFLACLLVFCLGYYKFDFI